MLANSDEPPLPVAVVHKSTLHTQETGDEMILIINLTKCEPDVISRNRTRQ